MIYEKKHLNKYRQNSVDFGFEFKMASTDDMFGNKLKPLPNLSFPNSFLVFRCCF